MAERLENNMRAFIDQWLTREEFKTAFDSRNNADYVDALFANAGVVPSQAERESLISGLNRNVETRASVLRQIAENPILYRQEYNQAFVLMQYFAYLQRSPDEAPDKDLTGFNFWLSKLNEANGDFVKARMVDAFINSKEYRRRFGPR